MTATAMIELQLELLKEAKDRIAELEADKQRLWDSIEAGESVYKRNCVSLEAENKRLSLDRDDWMGRYNALYDNGPLHRLEAENKRLRDAAQAVVALYGGTDMAKEGAAVDALAKHLEDTQ